MVSDLTIRKMPIYVETLIDGTMEMVWEKTQNPREHEKWDLRFTRIVYLPKISKSAPQHFSYETRIGFGLCIQGVGVSKGEVRTNTERVSVLKFSSDHPLSLIKTGSGYWKYILLPNGKIRFLTWYDYEVRWGKVGSLIDSLLFRPLLGRATAWSFDCLRLWIEKNAEPREMRLRFWVDFWGRLGLAGSWFYQGLIPKLIFPQSGELEILLQSGVDSQIAPLLLTAIGLFQMTLGFLFILCPHGKWLFQLTLVLLTALGIGVLFQIPSLYTLPFNPASLSIAMGALALVGWVASMTPVLPKATHCLRHPKKEQQS